MIDLYNDDCFNIFSQIPDNSIDAIICDLPYGITSCGWDIRLPFDKLWNEYERIIKENGAIILFATKNFKFDLVESNRILFKYEIIWEKTMPSGFMLAKKRPLEIHESILLFYKKQPIYNPQMTEVSYRRIRHTKALIPKHHKGGVYDNSHKKDSISDDKGQRFPKSIVKFSNWNGGGFGIGLGKLAKHPTQKPIDLMEWLVKMYTNEGDTILDNCMGSGSTGVACKNLNRKFIGIEKEKEFFEIAAKRINDVIISSDKSLSKETEENLTLF